MIKDGHKVNGPGTQGCLCWECQRNGWGPYEAWCVVDGEDVFLGLAETEEDAEARTQDASWQVVGKIQRLFIVKRIK